MGDETSKDEAQGLSVANQRCSIRYAFVADATVLDLASFGIVEGVVSDLSMGGAFVCTARPLAQGTRARITMTRKKEKVEALATVRTVKPGVGMGVEFIDVASPFHETLGSWVDQLRNSR
jgi:hypothetical protein